MKKWYFWNIQIYVVLWWIIILVWYCTDILLWTSHVSKIHYNLCKQQTETQSILACELSKSASSKLLRFCKIWLGKQCAYYHKVFIVWTLQNKRECNLTMHFIDIESSSTLWLCMSKILICSRNTLLFAFSYENIKKRSHKIVYNV